MENKTQTFLKKLNPNRIIIPILIGVAAFIYLSFSGEKDLDSQAIWANIQQASFLWIFLSIVVLMIRDAGYVYRIRLMTNKELSWTACVYVIILWEFSSAITPSVVGGTAVAVFILNQEGVKFGRSLAFVMTTAVFDNLFFFTAAVTVLLIMPDEMNGLMENYILLGPAFYFSLGLIAFYSVSAALRAGDLTSSLQMAAGHPHQVASKDRDHRYKGGALRPSILKRRGMMQRRHAMEP